MRYNLFISHSWAYSDQYDRLVSLLDNSGIDYRNYSIPMYDPIDYAYNSYQLKEAIYNQMKPASCVLILAGVYSTYSEWINIELGQAVSLGKPIIAIEPWGSQRTSATVKTMADYIVGWNTNSIVNAIKQSQRLQFI